jgi:hypothetical protein
MYTLFIGIYVVLGILLFLSPVLLVVAIWALPLSLDKDEMEWPFR